MKDTAWMGGSITVHRVFLYPLISCVLAFAPTLAQAASPDGAASTEGFQIGGAFSVRKAMLVAYGNVDAENKSRFESDETKARFLLGVTRGADN